MTDYGPQDTSTTTLGANQFPIAENWTPNAGFSAVEGGPQSTDAGGKKSAPVSVYAKDGSNVTQGAQADAAYTDGTGAASGTGMGLFKGIFVKLAAIAGSVAGTLKVKGDFTEVPGQAAGSVTSTSTDLIPSTDMSAYSFAVLQLSGTWTMTFQAQWSNDNFATAPVAGETGTIGASGPSTSITTNGMYVLPKYGRYLRIRPSAFTSNASCVGTLECYTQISPQLLSFVFASQSGTWTVQPGNTANTTPWLVTANQPTSATATLANVGGSVTSVALQASNANRKGWYCFNDSTSALYINFGATASATAFTVKVPAGGFFEMPTSPIYTGAINGIWDTATGSARVTELT